MKINFNDLRAQNKIIRKKILSNFEATFQNSKFILGPQVKLLEKKLSKYTRSKYCITTSSGTDSLLISLMSLGIKRGDEVITTSFTYISTAEVITRLGAKVVFIDISLEDYNIEINSLKKKINHKTKAIIVVSLFGQPANFKQIKKISKKIPIIEDGAQSFGSSHHNVKSCNLSLIGCTSFFPSKSLGCYGDGGAIFTNNKNLYKKMLMIRQHGQKKKYDYKILGISARLDTLQAIVLIEKIKLLDKEISARKKKFDFYYSSLNKIKDLEIKKIKKENRSNYSILPILVKKNRQKLIEYLNKNKIPTAIYYPKPLNYFKIFKSFKKQTPNATDISKKILSLPMSAYLSKSQQIYIVKKIKEYFIK
jgi:UDP-2-acetamido-2-deoxy-ribo-hexuluronate aminotransferase